VNLNERFWDQLDSTITVTVGEGSQVKGLKDGNIILKEKNLGGNLRIKVTCCPDFKKNILSVKQLQMAGDMVAFDDDKATIKDQVTKEITFLCDKRKDKMFYLRDNRMENNIATLLQMKEENGKTLKREKLMRREK
jgi:hypothetical protein